MIKNYRVNKLTINKNIPFSFMKYKHHMQSSNLNTGLDNVCHYSMAFAIDIGIKETPFINKCSYQTQQLS